MEFLGLSITEMLVIAVVAILVFGSRLPQVAGEAAATLQRVKRSLADLRRETGIDQEIARARREFETNVRRPLAVELPETIRRETKVVKDEIRRAAQAPGEAPAAAPPEAPAAGAPPSPPPDPAPGASEAAPSDPATPPPGS